MQRQQRLSLGETILVLGFVLSFAGLLAAGCFEACKIVSVVPAAFESSPSVLRNPMMASDDDSLPSRTGRRRMTPQQRAAMQDQ
jgi:hypothetical protein